MERYGVLPRRSPGVTQSSNYPAVPLETHVAEAAVVEVESA